MSGTEELGGSREQRQCVDDEDEIKLKLQKKLTRGKGNRNKYRRLPNDCQDEEAIPIIPMPAPQDREPPCEDATNANDRPSSNSPRSWIEITGLVLGHVLLYGFLHTMGLYYTIFLDAFNDERGPTSGVIALCSALFFIVAPIANQIMKKTGVRQLMLFGSATATIGLLVSSFAQTLEHLGLTFGIVTGVGLGLLHGPICLILCSYYTEFRLRSIVVAALGTGISALFYPCITHFSLQHYGWRGCLAILAGITCHLVLASMFMTHKPQGNTVEMNNTDRKSVKAVFHKWRFVFHSIHSFLLNFGTSVFYVHISSYAESLGCGNLKSAMLFTGIGVCYMIGSVTFGSMGQKYMINMTADYSIVVAIAGLPTILMPILTSYIGLTVAACTFGFFVASQDVYTKDIISKTVAGDYLSGGIGVINIFRGFGYLLGPLVAGYLCDTTLSYRDSFFLGGAALVLCNVFLLGTWRGLCQMFPPGPIYIPPETLNC